LQDLGARGQDSDYWKVFSGRGAALLADFGAQISSWRAEAAQLALPALFDRILAGSGYPEYLQDGSDEGAERWENVQELRKLAYEYQQRGLEEFLENLALVSDQDTLPEQLDAPTLLTLHAAKGLEFPQVFIIGLDEGLLPHSRSRDDPEELAEERRLFYVGLTRAKNHIHLVRAGQRSSFGSFEYSDPSRFVEDIPEELLQHLGLSTQKASVGWNGYGRTNREESRQAGGRRWEPLVRPGPSARLPEPELTLRPTQRVRHPVWGEGIVLESRIQDGEETADISFESVGFKRVIVSLARLELL